eukprot:50626_1
MSDKETSVPMVGSSSFWNKSSSDDSDVEMSSKPPDKKRISEYSINEDAIKSMWKEHKEDAGTIAELCKKALGYDNDDDDDDEMFLTYLKKIHEVQNATKEAITKSMTDATQKIFLNHKTGFGKSCIVMQNIGSNAEVCEAIVTHLINEIETANSMTLDFRKAADIIKKVEATMNTAISTQEQANLLPPDKNKKQAVNNLIPDILHIQSLEMYEVIHESFHHITLELTNSYKKMLSILIKDKSVHHYTKRMKKVMKKSVNVEKRYIAVMLTEINARSVDRIENSIVGQAQKIFEKYENKLKSKLDHMN